MNQTLQGAMLCRSIRFVLDGLGASCHAGVNGARHQIGIDRLGLVPTPDACADLRLRAECSVRQKMAVVRRDADRRATLRIAFDPCNRAGKHPRVAAQQ